MRYVFDIDDTISRNDFRDYENARPIEATVALLRKLKRMSGENVICLYTSRGMVSHCGDVKAIENSHRERLVNWLRDNDVPYDELIFGKPYGDVYVDDKAVNAIDFETHGVEEFRGFSGGRVVKVGKLIVKEAPNALAQRDWYDRAERLGFGEWAPKVFSAGLGKIYMEYVSGACVSDVLVQRDDQGCCKTGSDDCLEDVCVLIECFKRTREDEENDVVEYVEYVKGRANAVDATFTEKDAAEIIANPVLRQRTFCHGDLTPQNLILAQNGRLIMIDPSYKSCFSTYLLDASKFRVSLRGLDNIISGGTRQLSPLISNFDAHFTDDELTAIKTLEKTHIVRVLYYAVKLGKLREAERLRAMLTNEEDGE